MKNLFEISDYPNKEPGDLAVGSRWVWKRPDITEAYPTTNYTLKYFFSSLGSSDYSIEIVASKLNSAHVIEATQSATDGFDSGEHSWSAVVVRDSDNEQVTVDQGFIEISPSPISSDNTQAGLIYATLEAIRETIKGTASQEQQSYSINGRSLSRRTPEELMRLEQEYSRKWKNEKTKADRKAGRPTGGRVLVKMGA